MVSILMPAYNCADFIAETLRSVLKQNFTDFELIIIDDCSTDNTSEIIQSFKDQRIKFYQNQANVGYCRNLRSCNKLAKGDIIYLMADDDIMAQDALQTTCGYFADPEIGAVTRPYFWFDDDINKPVRAKQQLNPSQDEVVRIYTLRHERVIRAFQTLDQLSGLAMRRKFIEADFNDDIFTCHIYPFASIFKKHPVIFLKDYTIAVRIKSSQTRKLSHIYDKSPMQSWVDMVDSIFPEPIFDYLISDFIAVNYVGLAQIRNYSRFKNTLREIYLLIKYRPKNLITPAFWIFALGAIIIPPFLLKPLVDWYKNNINSKRITHVNFKSWGRG
jgi:glycosyltransferase involved in cell wall biosynthesis